VGGVPTLYARIGDLFEWLCVVGLGVAPVIAAIAHGGVKGQTSNNGPRAPAPSNIALNLPAPSLTHTPQ
jgi:hypothetical protein